jgi:hypothetical protein
MVKKNVEGGLKSTNLRGCFRKTTFVSYASKLPTSTPQRLAFQRFLSPNKVSFIDSPKAI